MTAAAGIKKRGKSEKELDTLFKLVDLYIGTGQPVGSNTLKESALDGLSSATIRNYFAKLEEDGYLLQLHASGGRIPSEKGLRLYYNTIVENGESSEPTDALRTLSSHLSAETREIGAFLQKSGELLSDVTNGAVFISSPRFDHDFVTDLKLVAADDKRVVCLIMTDFGLIHTEIVHLNEVLGKLTLKKIEAYCLAKLRSHKLPGLDRDEKRLAENLYNEIMLRHIVNYMNFNTEDVHKTGFSKLLNYPELSEASKLASALSLFENPSSMRQLIHAAVENNGLTTWIGDELSPFVPEGTGCSVIAIPYHIHQATVGTIAILGPTRLPYKEIVSILRQASTEISKTLTGSVYKYKLTYRQPETSSTPLIEQDRKYLAQTQSLLLEDKSLT